MSAETSQATMQSPPTANGTRVIVVRRWPIDRNRWKVFAILALVDAIVGGGILTAGIIMTCYNEYCDSLKTAYIATGSTFLFVAGFCLVGAIVLHKKMRMLIRLEQSSPAQQPVTFTPGYLYQPAIALPTVITQYPPPYPPPTGPTNNPLPPAGNQYPPPAGFPASPQSKESFPQEATKPPPYSP